MRIGLGFVLSLLFHVLLVVAGLYWVNTPSVRVNLDRPVYTVDLISLAPPPPPTVEVAPQPQVEAPKPEVEAEAKPEPAVETKPVPVVEAKPEPKPEKVEKISPKKVEKKTIIKKKPTPEPKPEPKPKPKPKPKKTAEQIMAEKLAAAKKRAALEDKKKKQAMADKLANLRKQAEAEASSAAGVEGGQAGGVQGGAGSGLSEVYALIVGSAIKKNWRFPSFAGEANLYASVEVVLQADGKVLSAKIVESSNNPEFDNSTLRAIRETEYVEEPRTERDKVLRINFNSQELSQ